MANAETHKITHKNQGFLNGRHLAAQGFEITRPNVSCEFSDARRNQDDMGDAFNNIFFNRYNSDKFRALVSYVPQEVNGVTSRCSLLKAIFAGLMKHG